MTHFLMKVEALDHKNNTESERINAWQIKGRKLYSNTSKSNQIAVATPRTPPDNFLSLHKNTSAASYARNKMMSEFMNFSNYSTIKDIKGKTNK